MRLPIMDIDFHWREPVLIPAQQRYVSMTLRKFSQAAPPQNSFRDAIHLDFNFQRYRAGFRKNRAMRRGAPTD